MYSLRFLSLAKMGARRVLQMICVLALAALGSTPARASTSYGDLNNFDVFNDTGQNCYGFEIELDDVHSTDITYTYDWNHYGAPAITEDNSDLAHPKVFVRYAAKYAAGTFSAFTAVPTTPPSPTNGHMCTDPSVNFGCEHFGVGHYGVPTVVKYHWLIEDPSHPGTLIQGPAVNVATPTWTYYPPVAAQPAQVVAAIPAPVVPIPAAKQYGEPTWVKVIKTKTHNVNNVVLGALISDDTDNDGKADWQNQEPDEVETEWKLLQANSAGNAAKDELQGGADDMGDGSENVTRRYEFYHYAAAPNTLDGENGEAMCDEVNPTTNPADPQYLHGLRNNVEVADANGDPYFVDCTAQVVVGDYIGAQMAGFNVEAVLGLIDNIQDGDLNEPYTPRTIVVGGNTDYVTAVSSGALPPGLSIDSASGVLSGTPTAAGQFTFTIMATDADLVQVSKPYTMTIVGVSDACAGVICSASDVCHDAGACDPATGLCSDPAKPDGTGCNDGDACTQTDSCQTGVCTGANPVTCAASDQCHVAGTCDSATGSCSSPAAPDGSACNDGDACTQTDSCQTGVCTGANPVACTASDQCHVAGTCDSATGSCSNPTAANGAPCNDGDACTQSDSCQTGVCTGANPVTCTASDQCHVAGTCNSATGSCSNPAAPNGTACTDGDACTQTDTCQAGVCTGSNPNPTCASADLSLKLQLEPKHEKAGRKIESTLTVRNKGPNAATSVTANFRCSGVKYHIVKKPKGCVATGTSIACALGTLPKHRSVRIDITIVAHGPGVLTCTASAYSPTPDPDLTNQSETERTRIRH